MAGQRLIVCSDLHISASVLDDCDQELEEHFVAFCAGLASAAGPVELVINGDFLDFVQAPPWRKSELAALALFDSDRYESESGAVPLCFTQGQSVRKLEAIGAWHKPVFGALAALLESNAASLLTILPGNHDADFFWKDVQGLFRRLVCGEKRALEERIRFHLDQVYRPASYPGIWIEHGHQHDPCNAFVDPDGNTLWGPGRPPIFAGKDGWDRLFECPGTRFLIKYLNELDEEYPYVDNVKPFSKFFSLFAASAFQGAGESLKVALSMWRIARFLAGRVATRWSDLLSIPVADGLDFRERLATVIEKWPARQQDELLDRLERRGKSLSRPIPMSLRDPVAGEALLEFLSDNLDLVDGYDAVSRGVLSLSGEAGTLSLKRGLVADETLQLKKAAQQAHAGADLDMVIMGHTHERVEPSTSLRYINTGCWTRYARFPPGMFTIAWSELKRPSAGSFPYSLDYVEVTGPGRAEINFKTFAHKP